jgi:cellulose synthase/poly-beta-1,6-N-acetylglucosamine synthase-like glycosyltransferase
MHTKEGNGMQEFAISAYYAIMVLLSLYGLHRLHIGWLYLRVRSLAPEPPEQEGKVPSVTVQLPMYNEENVVKRLLDATCRLDWPASKLHIQVLDDSTDDTRRVSGSLAEEWREEGVNIEVLERSGRRGYKAGALQYGLERSEGELIAIFDADFIPPRDFLQRTVPHFQDPGIGMVQARWDHHNGSENLLTRLSSILLDGHFMLEHTARNRSGRFFNFNGTAGIWRREAIVQAGGWQHDTITEDLDISYRAQLSGWRFVYLQDLLAPAELPSGMKAFKLQQFRWAKGTLQTARKLLPRILGAPIPLPVKLEAFVHLTSNVAYPLTLILALMMPIVAALRAQGDLAWTGILDVGVFLATFLSICFFYALSLREAQPQDWTRGLWKLPMAMALGIGLSVSQSHAVAAGLIGKDITFVRTPKQGDSRTRIYRTPWSWTAVAEVAIGTYCMLGIVASILASSWHAIPFLALFSLGFLYVGLASLGCRSS